MTKLRPLALTAGRALALLAALMVALLPALPAEAHAHAPNGFAAPTTAHAHHAAAALASDIGSTAPDQHQDRDGQPQHACDCCLSHVPVMPSAAIVPLPSIVPGVIVRVGNRAAPPDALADRQPEPPRPSA